MRSSVRTRRREMDDFDLHGDMPVICCRSVHTWHRCERFLEEIGKIFFCAAQNIPEYKKCPDYKFLLDAFSESLRTLLDQPQHFMFIVDPSSSRAVNPEKHTPIIRAKFPGPEAKTPVHARFRNGEVVSMNYRQCSWKTQPKCADFDQEFKLYRYDCDKKTNLWVGLLVPGKPSPRAECVAQAISSKRRKRNSEVCFMFRGYAQNGWLF
jgi:hypothetical protein